jgi:hypothetical protein
MEVRQGGCLCALIITLVAGCGSGGDSRSVDAYRNHLGAICRAGRRQEDAVAHYKTYPEFVMFVVRLRKITDHELTAVRALNAPASLRSRASQLDKVDVQTKALVDGFAQQVLSGQDPRGAVAQFRPRSRQLTLRADELFRRLGVPSCVS